MTNQHVNELAIYRLHKLKDFSGSTLHVSAAFRNCQSIKNIADLNFLHQIEYIVKILLTFYKPIRNHFFPFSKYLLAKMYQIYKKAGTNNDYQNIWVFS